MKEVFDPHAIDLSGVQLIEASAGTGKTFSITSLYLRLVLERKLLPEQILVVTFTEAATAELHERVRSRLRQAERGFAEGSCKDEFIARLIKESRDREKDRLLLQRALGAIDQAAISTIHGFCYRVLRHDALASGLPFDLELTSQPELVLRDLVTDYLTSAAAVHEERLFALFYEAISEKEAQDLAREALRRRHYPLEPRIGLQAVQELAGLAAARFATARNLWLANREIIYRLLGEAAGLTAPFRRILEAGLLERLAEFFAGPVPASFRIPAQTENLTPRRMADSAAGVFTPTAIRKGGLPGHEFFAAWAGVMEILEQLARAARIFYCGDFLEYVRAEFPRRLLAERRMSFDDLLYLLENVLSRDDSGKLARVIRDRFPVALIDEFQDTDPVQYRIFWNIYGGAAGATLFLIGDPKQAIYSFRGADIYAYLSAAQQPATRRHTMSLNWRADPDMVLAVNHLFAPAPAPFFDNRIEFPEVKPAAAANLFQGEAEGGRLEFLTVPEEMLSMTRGRVAKTGLEKIIPELLARDLTAFLAGGARIGGRRIRPGDIAVLVRTNEQAASIKQALQRRGINAVLQSKHNVLQSREAEQLLRLLRGIADPGDHRAVISALASDFLGCTAADLAGLLADDRKFQAELEQFSRWHGLWLQKGVMHLLNRVEEERGVAARLMVYGDGPRRFTNFRHLAELLQRAELREGLRHTAVAAWLAIQGGQEQTAEDFELRLESDDNAVQLVTVHRSKGLEYPVVYCPYLWIGVSGNAKSRVIGLHDPGDGWRGKFVIFPDEKQLRARYEEEFAEGLRLLYVAVTRAKYCCKLLWAPATGYDASPLAYLIHGAGPAAETPRAASSCEALADDLRRRAAGAFGWVVRPLAIAEGRGEAENVRPPVLDYRRPLFPVSQAWRMSSFSHLAAQAAARGGTALERDHDEAAQVAPAGEGGADKLPLSDFPRGPIAGNFFHEIFENLCFAWPADGGELEQTISPLLSGYGFAAEWRMRLVQAIRNILAAPLGEGGFCLADIDDGRKLTELEFCFPVAMRPGGVGFSSTRLAAAFQRYPAGIAGDYAEALERLPVSSLRGFMKGFIDLVFEHQGRWYLLDYKSNHLGESPADYTAEKLRRSMAEHHYYLQYHLYAVALDRYLRCRIPDYSYGANFGGVWYLFLRGMAGAAGPGQGVFFDRPPEARLRELSLLFTGAGAEA